MRPGFLSEAAAGLPAHPHRGLAGTAVVHGGVIALLLAAVAPRVLSLPTGAGAGPNGPRVELVPPPAALPPPVLVIGSGPALDAVDAMPPAAPFTTRDGFSYDTSRIRQRREVLFPFLTGRLPFLDELRATAARERQRLRNPLGSGAVRQRSAAPPLRLTAGAQDALIDRAWSRRDRWQSLAEIVGLTARYDADAGDLPAVLRGHVERNLLQPYFESSVPDPRFWVMLGLAADHVDVIEFVGRYAQRHPSSRTTTELLFLLDELAEANRGAFELLIQTNVAGLTSTASSSPQDVQLAWQIQRGYEVWTRERALDRVETFDKHYDTVRLAILSTIVESSPDGYGVADARFVAGRLLWDRSDIAGAVSLWRQMGADERTTYADVRAEIGRALRPDGSVDVIRVVRALGAERGRWLRESADRLALFGFTPQTF
jgi:hypothetical protein